MDTKMNIKDLKSGDVLLFSAEKGSFISLAIEILTEAKVSHAAMFYDEKKQTIIEETPPQVAVNDAVERFKEREISVMRLKKHLPMAPVIEISTNYLNNNEPYDMRGLYIVGILLVYKKFAPNTFAQKVIIEILKKLTVAIVKYINKHKEPGKTPMVCSQFVAQCYAEAGDDYKLKIENGVLQVKATNQKVGGNILDQTIQIIKSGKKANLQTLLTPQIAIEDNLSISAEKLCEELINNLNLKSSASKTPDPISDELVNAVSQFAHVHYLAKTNQKLTDNVLQNGTTEMLKYLSDDENMFTFPGDLLNHCSSLEDVGVIK
jgi:hypothetical protein